MHAVFNSLFTKILYVTSSLNNYTRKVRNFGRNAKKYFLRCNFHRTDFYNQSCKLWQDCLLHDERVQHESMNCNDFSGKCVQRLADDDEQVIWMLAKCKARLDCEC